MTRATDEKPVRRVVDGASVGELVIEVRARTLTIRPKGARAASAVVELTYGGLYTHALIVADDTRRRRARGVHA